MTVYSNWSQVPFAGALPALGGPPLSISVGGRPLVMPYNYLPFFAAPADDLELGNRAAPSHESWADDTYCGSITLTWTARRPIFSGVLSRMGEAGIPVYDVPRTSEGHPVLQGTMTKGPLRNLFAAITGSRLDSLPADLPLTYRSRPQDALLRNLARVRTHTRSPESEATLVLDVCDPPQVEHSLLAHPNAHLTQTVALPREHLNGRHHGERVWAWLELAYHHHPNPNQAYHYWRTVEPVVLAEDHTEPPVPAGKNRVSRHEPVRGHALVLVEAQIHETGERTFGSRKHDERLWVGREVARAFAPDAVEREEVALTNEVSLTGAAYEAATDAWTAVLESYIGAEPPANHQPAHYTREAVANAWAKLEVGQTLYYLGAPNRPELDVFVPGMVSRESYTRSPAAMVPTNLQPPLRPADLSAVQRVFGVVAEGDDPFAGKGLLEFGGLRCTNVVLPAPAVHPWTLAPQGQPKSGYGRFTTDGANLRGRVKSELFGPNDRLAGRRVWLHHQASMKAPPAGGWPFSPSHRPDGGERPYLAGPEAQSASQVIQFSGWIPPGAEFQQTLRFKNLTALELGALLWVLDKPRYHHIGRARGFGFGSAQVVRTSTRIQDAQRRRASLKTLRPSSATYLSSADVAALRDQFQTWVGEHRGASTRTAIMAASLPYADVRYPSLSEYGDLERGNQAGTVSRPALPSLTGRNR